MERYPIGIGEDLELPLLHNYQQQEFLRVKRLRYCLVCRKVGSIDGSGRFICPHCGTHHQTNGTAPRVFHTLGLFAGRQGGKTLIAAHGAREEILVPGSIGWVMGPTYKILHDSTFPTLVRLLPKKWVKKWDKENMEIDFINGSKVAFRSLEDPERARGPHVTWGWFDEAALSPERAFHVFQATLATTGGITFVSTSPAGFDWTWEQSWKKAMIEKLPGFWAAKYKTLENPVFQHNPALRKQVEAKRKVMTDDLFRQEYEADFVNFTGAIYGHDLIENHVLQDDDAIRKFIPEWPAIDPSRQVIVGLDSGADHPFGSTLMVVTPRGLVVVGEYLKRNQATSAHLNPIKMEFYKAATNPTKWAGNKNEANLRLEWGLLGVGVIPAENKHEIGIQRVQSWLLANQMWFGYNCPLTIAQMKAYRYAINVQPDGQKKAKEEVFKKDDELPDAIRYSVMAWPVLPVPVDMVLNERQQMRMDAMSDKDRRDLEIIKGFINRDKATEIGVKDKDYPTGDFFGGGDDDQFSESIRIY